MSKYAIAVAALLASGPLAGQPLHPGPYAAVSDSSVFEPASGSVTASFTIGVSGHASPVTVSYATGDGTAFAGTDYTAVSDSVVFQPGEYLKTITVEVLADPTQSGNESFTLGITAVSAGTVVRPTGVCTIVLGTGGLRGDANADGIIDVLDVFYIVNYVFAHGPAPVSTCAGDANADGVIDANDAFYLINYLFAGGPAPTPSGC